MSTPNNIILCGFMGTGKTTVGQHIAAQFGWRFVDTDKLIEDRCGKTVREIFAEDGEAAFRQMERELCGELADWRDTVIATGGGIVLNPNNRIDLESAGLVVCLEAPAQEIVNRLAGNTDRPLLAGDDPAGKVQELLTQRAEVYVALPHHVDTSGKSPAQLADEIISLWRDNFDPPDPALRQRLWDRLKPILGLNLPINNPIYKYEIRDFHWLRGLSPVFWGWKLFGLVYGGVALLGIAAILHSRINGSFDNSIAAGVLLWIAGLSFLAFVYGFIADARYVMMTVNAISDQILTGQWDILRLTRLTEQEIIDAKHGAAIVQSWRTMTIDRLLHTVPALASLILLLTTSDEIRYFSSSFAGLNTFSGSLVAFLFGFILPYWRMRGITATGLALSSRIRLDTYSALAGFGVAFGMKVVELAISIVRVIFGFFSGAFMALAVYNVDSLSNAPEPSTYIFLEVFGFLVALAPALATLFVYVLIENMARSFAYRTAFYSDRQP